MQPTPPADTRIAKPIGKGKSGYSFLATRDGHEVVFKQMHNEPVLYYSFSGNKVDLEIAAYRRLHEIGIRVPELLSHDREQGWLVKQYISGQTGVHWITGENRPDEVIGDLFAMARKAQQAGLNLDYFPANFVIDEAGRLWYIDYEFNPYDPQWSLEHWGIWYWANFEGFQEFLRTGDPYAINSDPGKGIPVKEPNRARVKAWIAGLVDDTT